MQDDTRSDRSNRDESEDDFGAGKISLVHCPWTEDEARRYMALRRIFGPHRHGVVDGVEFDLRHPLLDPEEWHTFIIGDKAYASESSRGPLLWFPWMGVFDEATLRKKFFPDDDVTLTAEEAAWLEELIRQHTPEQFVYVGDKLVVDSVECIDVGETFDHLHDREIRHAYLNIARADGRIVEVSEPLQFIGRSTVTSFHSVFGYYRAIVWRILKHFKLKDFSETEAAPNETAKDEGYAGAAFDHAFALQKRIERELHMDFYCDGTRAENMQAQEKIRLVNDAVALGYIWAKAEDQMNMQPLAEVSLRVKSGGERGGRKSGEARREKRATTWEPHARELAIAIRKANPTYSQDRVATEIASGWKTAEFDPPTHPTLKALVSAMEKEGTIELRKLG